jgi:hypothetical protein
MCLILKNIFTFHRLEYISWNYNCLLEFQKRNIIFIQENITVVPFRTTKDCHSCRSLLLVGRIFPSTGILTWTALWGHYLSSLDGPVTKYMLEIRVQGAWARILGVLFHTFPWWHPCEPRFKSGFIIPFEITYCSSWQIIMNDFGNI